MQLITLTKYKFMSKIEIRDISIIFGNEKTKARKMLDEHKSKQDILKATG